MNLDTARNVIEQFYRHHLATTSPAIEDLGTAGGFSGANLYRMAAANGTLCLRCWPHQMVGRESRLKWIHNVVRQACQSGCTFLAVPLPNCDGHTLTVHNGLLWQLEPWLAGRASYWSAPDDAKLVAAINALASFHRATNNAARPARCSPGIAARHERLGELWHDGSVTERFLQIELASSSQKTWQELAPLARRICNTFRLVAPEISRQLNWAIGVNVEIQPVFGDIWHDHVLFDDQGNVSGIIDYGAMREDTPATDLARLVGSLVGDDGEQWSRALNQWETEIATLRLDRELCRVTDHATTVTAAVNWLEWICVENRDFGPLEPVFSRLQRLARRMDFLAASL